VYTSVVNVCGFYYHCDYGFKRGVCTRLFADIIMIEKYLNCLYICNNMQEDYNQQSIIIKSCLKNFNGIQIHHSTHLVGTIYL